MSIHLAAATGFMAMHARILDRRRFELLTSGGGEAVATLAALDGYRNPDGGYGWGLEPDLRSPESQPGASHHAFEVFAEIAPAIAPQAVALCDWLGSVMLRDGGLPMALPTRSDAGVAPWWGGADPSTSSLQITAIVAATAHRAARHDPAVAAHPWLEQATEYCLTAIAELRDAPSAYVHAFSLRFLDAVFEIRPEAPALLERLASFVPDDGLLRVRGDEEVLRPLEIAPDPDRPVRQAFAADAVAANLDHLAGLQQEDGGWVVDFPATSPMGALDWRGYATVRAVDVLRLNGRVPTDERRLVSASYR